MEFGCDWNCFMEMVHRLQMSENHLATVFNSHSQKSKIFSKVMVVTCCSLDNCCEATSNVFWNLIEPSKSPTHHLNDIDPAARFLSESSCP